MNLTILPVPAMGAEDVVVTPDGDVFTGTEDGSIWRLTSDGGQIVRVAHTGGRPLGLELYDDGNLLVCDAKAGLLLVRPDSGQVEPLLTSVGGVPMRFCNNAAIASDGTIWFSDSSKQYGIEQWKDDFVQNTRTGRLLRRALDGSVEVIAEGLAFANGVAISVDESFVAVAETGARTVVRHWLSGAKAGQRDFLVSDLPGYPDNISRGSDGLIWVTIASPIDPLVERLQRGPMLLRKLATKVPPALQPKPKQTVRVQAFDDAGALVHDLDINTTDFHMVTGVREHNGQVWLGSLHEPAVAVLPYTQ